MAQAIQPCLTWKAHPQQRFQLMQTAVQRRFVRSRLGTPHTPLRSALMTCLYRRSSNR